MDAVEVDDVGAPVASEWFLKAFGSGEATKRRCLSLHKAFAQQHTVSVLREVDGIRIGRTVAL